MNPFEKMLPPTMGLAAAISSSHVFTTGQAYPVLISIRWINTISGIIYVGLLFFQLCVLPKGSLQSTAREKPYRKILNTAFVLITLSVIFRLLLEAGTQDTLFLRIREVWIVQFLIVCSLCIMPYLAKNRIRRKWISLGLGLLLLAANAMMNPLFSILPVLLSFFALISASIWAGSLIAFLIMLPIRKKPEGKIFFRGMIYLFFPWGAGALVVLAVTALCRTFI